MSRKTRRAFLRDLGLTAGALPFILNLPSLGFANTLQRKQRLVIMFSPNGVVPWDFWPDETGAEFTVKEILKPLEPYKQRMLVLHGVSNKIRGDGDNHMRGMACLLTGIELFPGNVQGGSHTPAGWAKGLSIDQEIARYLQSKPETSTRFGSLEFGIGVPDRADPWTRLVYAGPNRPVAPVMDPYQMLNKLYGQTRDQESLGGILDDVQDDLRRLRSALNPEDRRLLEEHESFVRAMELDLQTSRQQSSDLVAPELESGVKNVNDNLPKLAQMQIDLLVHSFVADFARVATLQITNSVGEPACGGSESTKVTTSCPTIRTRKRSRRRSLPRSTSGTASRWPTWSASSTKRPSRAVPARCWITRRSCGPTSSAKAIRTLWTTFHLSWRAMDSDSAWAGH